MSDYWPEQSDELPLFDQPNEKVVDRVEMARQDTPIRAEKLLRILKRHFGQWVELNTLQNEHGFHTNRGRHEKKYLVSLGHKIDSCRKRLAYRYMGYEKKQKISRKHKWSYWQSNHWKVKRVERLEFDDFECCHCHVKQSLQVHHWCYDLFNEDVEDLATLCIRCHRAIHANEKVSIKFPDSVIIPVYEKLEELLAYFVSRGETKFEYELKE